MKQKDRKKGPPGLTCCGALSSNEDSVFGFGKFAPQSAALERIFTRVPKKISPSQKWLEDWNTYDTLEGAANLQGISVPDRLMSHSWDLYMMSYLMMVRRGSVMMKLQPGPVSPLDSMVAVQKTPVMYNIYLDGRQGREGGRGLDAEKLQRATWWVVAQSPLFKITPFSLAFQHGAESDEEKGVLFKKITYQIVHLHAKCCCIM